MPNDLNTSNSFVTFAPSTVLQTGTKYLDRIAQYIARKIQHKGRNMQIVAYPAPL